MLDRVSNLLLFCLVFSIPFYTWNALGLSGLISIPKVIAILYFIVSLITRNTDLHQNIVRKYINPLIILFFWSFIVSFFSINTYGFDNLFNFSFAQYIILSIIIVNHIRKDIKLVPRLFIVFLLSIITISILYKFDVGTEILNDRRTIFGDNANNLAMRVATAGIICVSILFDDNFFKKKYKYFLVFLLPLFISVIGDTASRGGFIAFFIGITVVFVFKRMKFSYKFIILLIVFSLGTYIDNYFNQFEHLMFRMNQLIDEGDDARAFIFGTYWNSFIAKPFFGYGQNGFYELSIELFGIYTSPHNWFLYIAITSGMIGLIIFVLYVRNLLTSSYSIYKTTGNSLAMALVFSNIFNISKSGNQLTEITFWVFMSIIIGWNLALLKNDKKN